MCPAEPRVFEPVTFEPMTSGPTTRGFVREWNWILRRVERRSTLRWDR